MINFKNYGYISSIETGGFVDGPGIRCVVFLSGCNLRCKFCHNPETWNKKYGYKISPKKLFNEIIKYKNYYGKNGGVTFSGGEPLLQDKFLIKILKLCKKNNIHTTIDTAGVGNGNYNKILKYTDLVILDIKAIENDKYKDLTGMDIEKFNKFLEACQNNNKKLWLRQVIVPQINDSEEYIYKLKNYIKRIKNVEKVELLPYEKLGIHKYKELGIKYRLLNTEAMNKKRCKKLEEMLRK